MPRLFVAISLPEWVKTALQSLQPTGRGIRPVDPRQMHLTLHFLGEKPLKPTLDSLQRVPAREFELKVAGVGKFSSRDRSQVLWAGVSIPPMLQELHDELKVVLNEQGIPLETRPYSPHITLARCGRETPLETVKRFLGQHAGFALPPFRVESFELYSSRFDGRGHVYHCVQSFRTRGESTAAGSERSEEPGRAAPELS